MPESNDTATPAGPLEVESPIINSPFYAPKAHWQIKKGEQPVQAEGRRPASYYFRVPEHAERGGKKAKGQKALFEGAEVGQEEELALVNGLRHRVKAWRTGELTGREYDGVSPVTRELLHLIKYFESDAVWFKRIRQELGSGRGRSPQWLVFNDEAHHAYRRGDRIADEADLEEDKTLANKNAREATIWIEGLDRINKLAGGKRKGVRFCVDLSATPFYIQGSGNEVGKPFPWVASDFGLLDAIESGLVKIPQLPSRDATGAAEAAYFNIWRWIEQKAIEDGYGSKLTPEIVMTYASAPINLLAPDWHQRFREWEGFAKQQHKHPVPPVFIVVCRDTRVARPFTSGWRKARADMVRRRRGFVTDRDRKSRCVLTPKW